MVAFERWDIGSDLWWCSGEARGSPTSKLTWGGAEKKMCVLGKCSGGVGWRGRGIIHWRGAPDLICALSSRWASFLLRAKQSGFAASEERGIFLKTECNIWPDFRQLWHPPCYIHCKYCIVYSGLQAHLYMPTFYITAKKVWGWAGVCVCVCLFTECFARVVVVSPLICPHLHSCSLKSQ